MLNEIIGSENGRKLGKYVVWAMLLLTIFLGVEVLKGLKQFGYIGKEIYPQRTVMVTGVGEAYAIPDTASFSFSVVEVGKTAADAQEKANVKIEKARADLKEAGIEEKDIKTTNYSVYPKYEWNQIYCITTPCPAGKNVLTGYEVSQTITVKVRNIDKAGDLVTKIGASGVSSISGIEFTVDDKEKYAAMAREEAIKKAQENGKVLAKSLGVKLGKMLYFNENNGGYPYYAEGMGGDMKVSAMVSPNRTDLPAGENKITSSVSITYELR